MTKYETEMLFIDAESKQDLESAIEKIAELGDGWINVEPVVAEDHQNEVPGFFAWFSALVFFMHFRAVFLKDFH